MSVLVILNEYLDTLRKQEKEKPVNLRRFVPTIDDMADTSNFSRTAFYDFANNKPRGINREMADTAIKVLRSCGFAVDVSDIIKYIPNETDH